MEDGPSNNGTYSSFQGDLLAYPYRPHQGPYLMPVGLHDAASSQYNGFSIPSPVSTSRSISPFEGNLQDIGFLARDNGSNLANISGDGVNGIQAPSLHMSSDPLTLLVPPVPPVPSVLPVPQTQGDNHVKNLSAALAQVTTALEAGASEQGITRLYEIKDLLRVNYERHIAMIQHQIDTAEHLPHSPDSHDNMSNNRVRYVCYLCPPENRKTFQARGTFRRHVSYTHHRQVIYKCLGNNCFFASARRDKVYCHMRNHHNYLLRVTREQSHLMEIRVAPPHVCGLCSKPVNCWEEYFKCISEHCRIGNSSTSTSASHSRRGSDDRGPGGGGSGHGHNGYQFFGNGSGASGLQPSFPYGTGNSGGSSPNAGQNYGFYGTSFSNCVDAIGQVDNETISSESSGVTEAASHTESTPSSPSDMSRETAGEVLSSLTSQHRSLVRGDRPASLARRDSGQRGDEFPLSNSYEPASRRISDDTRRCILRSSSNPLDTTPKQDPRSVANKSFKRQCHGCGHLLDDCTKCQLMKGTVLKCHLCADMVCKTHDFREVEQSKNCKQSIDGNELSRLERPVSDDTRFLSSSDQAGGPADLSSDIAYAILEEQLHPSALAFSGYESREASISMAHTKKTSSTGSLGSICPGSHAPSASHMGHDAVAQTVAAKLHTSASEGLDYLLGEKTRLEAQELAHDCDHGDLHGTRKLAQTYNLRSLMKLQHELYSVLPFCVLTMVEDFLNHMHTCWLLYEAVLFHSMSPSCQCGQEGVWTDTTESAGDRRYLCYPSGKLRHSSPARRIPRKRHAQLRAKLHVIVELIVLRAAAMRKKSRMSLLTDTPGPEQLESHDINAEAQVTNPDSQGPRYLQVMFTRGTEVVGDVLSNLITGVIYATEEELDIVKPVPVYMSMLFTERSMWAVGEVE
ncbi:putative C2H2 zinc finger domain protein [Aspergillus ibericus CBS 121593]|uniref:C2H2-type domain-containing protein n=1 Tax=Aspergillus ibericus CBS 121593 TaxID=1448316 RepID=A0A395GR56_9EURO|nr:hypothetical protein BO80DRAFT_391521 [Aspergillus ibericus CBS 121593]RAK96553.1 hypothetical protein BO80DRAFT_391521 [Aspergillus ibericus CBS 121593]